MSEKKNIYNLSIKEMRELLIKFSNTLYGRTICFFAYFLPLMAFLAMCGLVIADIVQPSEYLFYPIAGTFFLFIGLFILGNAYYYHELRIFSERG